MEAEQTKALGRVPQSPVLGKTELKSLGRSLQKSSLRTTLYQHAPGGFRFGQVTLKAANPTISYKGLRDARPH